MPGTAESIGILRQAYGKRLAILAHHYQSDAVLEHADHVGDSLELARLIPGLEAEHVVFCGVSFMAESAAVLARPGQNVHTPAPEAGCTMSNMAPHAVLAGVLKQLGQSGRRIVPLAYVNSSLAVKAVAGRYNGAICTSANAALMLRWAMEQGHGVLFLPDRNLALNTAHAMGIPRKTQHILDIRGCGAHVDLRAAGKADLLIWPGCCSIHHLFKADRIREMRTAWPGALFVVHPECPPDTVREADAAGSTSFIIRYAAQAAPGSRLVIGTETNLVSRLWARHRADKTIIPLRESHCANMAKTTPQRLLATLRGLESVAAVQVEEMQKEPARLSLQRMLDACAAAATGAKT